MGAPCRILVSISSSSLFDMTTPIFNSSSWSDADESSSKTGGTSDAGAFELASFSSSPEIGAGSSGREQGLATPSERPRGRVLSNGGGSGSAQWRSLPTWGDAEGPALKERDLTRRGDGSA